MASRTTQQHTHHTYTHINKDIPERTHTMKHTHTHTHTHTHKNRHTHTHARTHTHFDLFNERADSSSRYASVYKRRAYERVSEHTHTHTHTHIDTHARHAYTRTHAPHTCTHIHTCCGRDTAVSTSFAACAVRASDGD